MDRLTFQAREDFHRAKQKAMFESIFTLLGIEKRELLPFYDVKDLLRPTRESYLGMRTIPVHKIVGSEGRYYDFSSSFLPKRTMLRTRWVSIDKAHLADINLPPIRVFKLGGCYFVRDGNHRVSVAKAQGVAFIDAEVIELDTEIEIDENMTQEQLRGKVVSYEREKFVAFLEKHGLKGDLNLNMIRFTAPGRYQEVLNHILVHKYYLNEETDEEITLSHAAKSWFTNLYCPIVGIIKREKVLRRFPRRTPGDLYMWVIKHWDDLKQKFGKDVSLETAAMDYSTQYGKGFFKRVLERIIPKRKR